MPSLIRIILSSIVFIAAAALYLALSSRGVSGALAMIICLVPATIVMAFLGRRAPARKPGPKPASRTAVTITGRASATVSSAPASTVAPAPVPTPKVPPPTSANTQGPAVTNAHANAETTDKLTKAGDFFYKIALKTAEIGPGIHAETLVIACSWMAGTMLYRSFAFPFKPDKVPAPGTPVFSVQANQSGPLLMDIMLKALQTLGHDITEQSVMASQDFKTIKTSVAGFPLLEAQKKLDPFYFAYCKAANLSHREAAFGSVIATALAIHNTREVLDMRKGAALAVTGFVEGCKTQPIPFAGVQATTTPNAAS